MNEKNRYFSGEFLWVGVLAITALVLGTTPVCAKDITVSSGPAIAASSGTIANMSSKTAKELAVGLRRAKSLQEKGPYLKALHGFKPKTEDDVKQLAELASETNDTRDPISEAAYRALSNIKPEDQKLEPVFRKMLDDKRPGVRYMALKNCGVLKSKQAMPSLIKQLREMKKVKTQEESWPLMGAEEGLALYGKEALPDLVKLYKESSDTEVKEYTRETIRQIRDKDAADELLAIVEDKNNAYDLRKTAIETLGMMQAVEVAKPLIGVYKSEKNIFLKTAIIFTFGELKSEESFTALADILLHDSDPSSRESAAMVIPRTSNRQTQHILFQAMELEKSKLVKQAIASSLNKLTGKSYDLETGREK